MKRVLIVEDNEMNRDMLSRRLIKKGYEVLIAVDGKAGVDMATAERPDIVLLDMSLPVMDGWEAARQLKAGSLQFGLVDVEVHTVNTLKFQCHVLVDDFRDGTR